MRNLLTLLAAVTITGAAAQSTGDYKVLRKHAGVGDSARYVAPSPNSLFSLNVNGMLTFLAQSNFANASHVHAAADITSGVLATARLGTGTANSSTYLRGDGTWQTLSSGVTDHGALTGLSDDDHPQYHNDARGDARYSLLGHSHDIDEITGLATELDSKVEGPGSAVDSDIPLFNGTTGSLLKSSGLNLSEIVAEDPGAGVGMIESGTGVSPIVLKNLKSGNGTTATANTGSVQVDIASDGVANTMLANMAQGTLKGRAAAAGTGDPTDLTPDQVSIILDAATDPFVRTSAAGGGGTWGSITGTLSAQTDLQSALDAKASQTALEAETTARTVADDAINVELEEHETRIEDLEDGKLDDGDELAIGLTFPPTGLRIRSPSAGRVLTVELGDALSDDRTLLIRPGDANRTLQLTGDAVLSGTNTGDQSESSIEALIDLQDCQGAVTDAQVPNNITITNLSGTNTGDQVVPVNTTATTSQWFSAYNATTGAFTKSQPAFSDISGSVSNTQLDADLAAIGNLTSAADKGIQFTGSGTAATYDLTTAGKELLDDADHAAQRTTLGVVQMQYDVVGSGQTTTSTSLADITGLSLTIAANASVSVLVEVQWECSSTSGGPGLGINGSSAATYVSGRFESTQSAGNYAQPITAYNATTNQSTCAVANTVYYAVLHARIVNGGSSSTITPQIARGGSGTLTIRSASITITGG